MADLALFFGQALTVAVVTALLVMVLSIFFKWLPRLGPKRQGLYLRSATELFEEGRHYDILLTSGQRLTALRFEGVVQADAEAGWPMVTLVVMRRGDGGKVFLQAHSVRVFEAVATTPDHG
jgi:hypothetical protein